MFHAARVWFAALALIVAPVLFAAGGGNLNHPTGGRGVIMVDKVGGYIRFFDPTTDKELASFMASDEAGLRPHELAIAPDGKSGYVSVYGDGVFGRNPHPGHTVVIVDLDSRKIVGSIDVAPYQAPHGIQVDAAGNVYVACDQSHKVLVLDPKKRSVEAAIDVEATGHWVALAPGANKLYVTYHGDKPFIGVIDLKSRKMIGKVPVATGTMGITASPDGKTVLAADATQPYLHIISTATDMEIGKVQVQSADKGLYKVFYSPDGRLVLTCLPTGQVNIFNAADLHGPQRVLQLPGTALMGIAFSADGKTALVGNHGEGTVSRIDLGTARVLDTFPAGKGVETLAYY